MEGKTIRLELVSPEKLLASEEATIVVIPGAMGDMGVMAEHAPLVSGLRPGVIVATLASGEEKKFFVTGGFADVTGELCSILAEQSCDVAEIDRAKAEQELREYTEQLSAVGADEGRRKVLERDIAIAEAKLAA